MGQSQSVVINNGVVSAPKTEKESPLLQSKNCKISLFVIGFLAGIAALSLWLTGVSGGGHWISLTLTGVTALTFITLAASMLTTYLKTPKEPKANTQAARQPANSSRLVTGAVSSERAASAPSAIKRAVGSAGFSAPLKETFASPEELYRELQRSIKDTARVIKLMEDNELNPKFRAGFVPLYLLAINEGKPELVRQMFEKWYIDEVAHFALNAALEFSNGAENETTRFLKTKLEGVLYCSGYPAKIAVLRSLIDYHFLSTHFLNYFANFLSYQDDFTELADYASTKGLSTLAHQFKTKGAVVTSAREYTLNQQLEAIRTYLNDPARVLELMRTHQISLFDSVKPDGNDSPIMMAIEADSKELVSALLPDERFGYIRPENLLKIATAARAFSNAFAAIVNAVRKLAPDRQLEFGQHIILNSTDYTLLSEFFSKTQMSDLRNFAARNGQIGAVAHLNSFVT